MKVTLFTVRKSTTSESHDEEIVPGYVEDGPSFAWECDVLPRPGETIYLRDLSSPGGCSSMGRHTVVDSYYVGLVADSTRHYKNELGEEESLGAVLLRTERNREIFKDSICRAEVFIVKGRVDG